MIFLVLLPYVLIVALALAGIGVLVGIKKQNDDQINISATVLILAVIGIILCVYLYYLLSQLAPT